jgi:molecular chaperone GrpE
MNERKDKPNSAAAGPRDNFIAGLEPEAQINSPDATQPDDSAASDEGPTTSGETMSIDEQIIRLKQDRDDLRDQLLRVRAEFANYQKRAKQQAEVDRVYAVGTLARDLLEPLDNLDRAIGALRAKGAAEVTAGLDMVQKQLHEILAKHGVEPIPAHGRPFDPNLHDAILQQPSLEHPEGTVVAEMTKGYTIRDRVLRPSKVAVSVKPASKEE